MALDTSQTPEAQLASASQTIHGDMVDGRTDQYSLACIVYDITSRPPFEGPSLMMLLGQHVTAPPPPLGSHHAVPDTVEMAIHRAMAKDPADRFAMVTAFVDALAAESPTRLSRKMPGSEAPPDRRLRAAGNDDQQPSS